MAAAAGDVQILGGCRCCLLLYRLTLVIINFQSDGRCLKIFVVVSAGLVSMSELTTVSHSYKVWKP